MVTASQATAEPEKGHSTLTYIISSFSLAMPTFPTLLSKPLEIRRQIYSYLLPNRRNINIVRDDMDERTSLFVQ